MKPIIGIIGGGAAGLYAALHAARNGMPVLLWESNAVLGRKLAVTGSGRGNLSNREITGDRYTCDAPRNLQVLLEKFPHDWLRREMQQLGVLTLCSDDGWYYPTSGSAAAVVEILAVALQKSNVACFLKSKIVNVQKESDGFLVHEESGRSHKVGRLIIATGGKAYPQLGASDAALQWLAQWGIAVLPMRPALAPLTAQVRALHKLQGVRLDVAAALYRLGELQARSLGNLMFTQYGFNGPAAMDLSHYVSLPHKETPILRLNFLPRSLEEFKKLYQEKKITGWPLHALLAAVLPVKLADFILGQANLKNDQDVASLSSQQEKLLFSLLTQFQVNVTGVKDFKFSQLAAGGMPLSEIDPGSMECKVRGLFLAGEILDVVGPCGGFNLHFAFASGAQAGLGASQAIDRA